MNKTSVITLLTIVSILAVAGFATYYFYSTPNDASDSEAKRTLATTEEQIFTDLNGNPLTLEEYEGRVRVVNTWASWTPFSLQELPLFEELAAQYSNEEVAFIAINRKESKEQARRFLNSLQPFERIVFVLDVNDTYYKSVGGYAMPETVIYDAKGNITSHKRGSMTLEEMRTLVEEAIEKEN